MVALMHSVEREALEVTYRVTFGDGCIYSALVSTEDTDVTRAWFLFFFARVADEGDEASPVPAADDC